MARFSTEADTAFSLFSQTAALSQTAAPSQTAALSRTAAVWQEASVTGQCVGRRLPGGGGPVEEAGEQFELGVGISGADLVHRGVHRRVEAQHLGAAVAERPDPHCAAVGLVAVARHPAAAF